jgi:hypothetical protein
MATATAFAELDRSVSILALVQLLEAARLCQDLTNHVLILTPPVEHYAELRAAIVGWAVQRNLDIHATSDGVIGRVAVLDGVRTVVTLHALVGVQS